MNRSLFALAIAARPLWFDRSDKELYKLETRSASRPEFRINLHAKQIMDGYEPPIADDADYTVPRTFRMVDAHVHWWDHADKTVSWGVSSWNWQHPRADVGVAP